MANISYNLGIPDAANDPSVDQPDMQENTNAIQTLLDQDHYAFNVGNGGQHKNINFPQSNVPANPVGLASVLFSFPGAADNTSTNLFMKNSAGDFSLSLIKAVGQIPMTLANNAALGFTTAINCGGTCASSNSGGTYTINLAGVKSDGVTLVWINSTSKTVNAGDFGYSFAGTTLTITCGVPSGTAKLNFLVIQV